ncbi:FmdB family zinc ribbon protein [Desulfoferrobacter suflitae]|uniref:FmdB family zinc ribbon protein n=1 Tax=Desulfoferrobacter suflitae TaxID=2865782 RepID=UPI002164E375|nr:zinc ribbon domain-containing protein [Desulfoferrobacter suflitae]MCK8600823.1 zinc ribbon domain-containing protein [Desulfoferrobacter suflitae]
MPIYEYECCDCCEKFETLVFRSDEAVRCPKCNSDKAQRVMSVCGFKSGGDKGAASSRMGSGGASCAGCTSGSCASCH